MIIGKVFKKIFYKTKKTSQRNYSEIHRKLDRAIEDEKDKEVKRTLRVKDAQQEFNKRFNLIRNSYSKKFHQILDWMNSNLEKEYYIEEWELDANRPDPFDRNGYIFEIIESKGKKSTKRESWRFHFFLSSFGPHGKEYKSEGKISCFAENKQEKYDTKNYYYFYKGSDFEKMIDLFMDELIKWKNIL